MIHHRSFALFSRLGCIIFTLFGILAVTGVFECSFDPAILVYFTIQSNLLALFLFILLFFRTLKATREGDKIGKTGYYPRFEMIVVVDILLTMIVYWVLLSPTIFTMSSTYSQTSFGNIATHLITPILCLIDYLLFTDSSHLKYKDVYQVLMFPFVYMVLTSLAGLLGYVYRISPEGNPVRFPYFFYDFDQLGAKAFIYIGALAIFLLLLSHGFYWFDQKVKKPLLLPK